MDLDDFRSILSNSGVDVWSLIETAISVASVDNGDELKVRRDAIVERLYATVAPKCRSCDVDREKRSGGEFERDEVENDKERESSPEGKGVGSPSTPESINKYEEQDRSYVDSIYEEKRKILAIRDQLDDPDEPEESLLELLQTLADMDITFNGLKETDIGRHVNRLRKHSSNEIRKLVKLLVSKWKDLVDEWAARNERNPRREHASSALMDGDSPQQSFPKNTQNGHHQQALDYAPSPNRHNGSSGSDKNSGEQESKGKAIPRKDAPSKPVQPQFPKASSSAPLVDKQREKETAIDPERFATARKRLHDNYQEANNAKKNRTIQMMEIHEIPKSKNSFIAKNKGGSQARHR